ncbi:hypothetical protein VTO73DRAFT_11238 [Trametes versicolor]
MHLRSYRIQSANDSKQRSQCPAEAYEHKQEGEVKTKYYVEAQKAPQVSQSSSWSAARISCSRMDPAPPHYRTLITINMSFPSNNAGSCVSVSTSRRLEKGSTTTSHSYNSGQAQVSSSFCSNHRPQANSSLKQSTSLFPPMSVYAQSAPDHMSSGAFPPAICQEKNGYTPGSLSYAGELEQEPRGYGQGETVFQWPWNSVENVVAVFNSTQALSGLLKEVILGANTERPSSEAFDVGEGDQENWIFDAPHDLEESLESIYASIRKPFEDCGVAPSSLKLMDDSIRITTYTPETIALPPPNKHSFELKAVRGRSTAYSASVVRSASSSAGVFAPKAGPPRISEYAQTIPLVISEPPRVTQSPGKRPRSSDAEDPSFSPPHNKAKSNVEEVIVSQAQAAPQDISLSPVADEVEPIVAGPSQFTPEPLHNDEAETDGVAMDGEAVPEVQENHTAQNDAPVPLQRQAYTPQPRRTNAELAQVTVPNLKDKQCGVLGCTTMFCPTEGEKNRPHIKGHHTPVQIASKAFITCAWAGCGHVEKGIWMTRHVERDHIKYGYFCPFENKCPIKWKGSRAKDQSWHMNVYHPGWRG